MGKFGLGDGENAKSLWYCGIGWIDLRAQQGSPDFRRTRVTSGVDRDRHGNEPCSKSRRGRRALRNVSDWISSRSWHAGVVKEPRRRAERRKVENRGR